MKIVLIFLLFNNSLTAYKQYKNKINLKPTALVNDYENILNNKEEVVLNNRISKNEKETTTEITIVTIDSTIVSAANFNNFSSLLLNKWGDEKKGFDNGILILISKQLKKISISNGYGTEKVLSNLRTKQIIVSNFIPRFRQEKYFEGIYDGLNAIEENLENVNWK